jgi:hypothetical protein
MTRPGTQPCGLGRWFSAPAIFAGLAAVLGGCSQAVYFRPTENAARVGGLEEARYSVVPAAGQPVGVTLIGRGLLRPDIPAMRYGVIAVRARINSPDATPASISDAYLADEDGRMLVHGQIVPDAALGACDLLPPGAAGAARRPGPATAPEWAIRSAELLFCLPPDVPLSRVRAFRVFWTAQIGDQAIRQETTFVRSAEPVLSDVNRRNAWTFGDTSEFKDFGVWYGIVGPPFGD